MKPVYETERRSNRFWLIPVALLVGLVFGGITMLVIMEKAVAQQASARVRSPTDPLPQQRPTVSPDDLAASLFPAAPVVKWEYTSLHEREAKMFTAGCNKLGAEGWELVNVTAGSPDFTVPRAAYFKRSLRDAAAAAPAEEIKATGDAPLPPPVDAFFKKP